MIRFFVRLFGHRRWLRATAYVFTLSYGHRAISSTGPRGQPGVNPYRVLCGDCTDYCAMSVQLPCSLRSLRTEIVRSPCGDRSSHGAYAGIVQYHLRHVYGLRAYDFSNVKNFSLKKIVEAAEPVNSYENLTPTSCLRREALQRPHGKGDTGRIRAP